MRKVVFLLAVVLALIGFSCKDDPETTQEIRSKQLNLDTLAIDAYLQANGIVAQRTDAGVRYVIREEGAGTNSPKYYANGTGDCFQTDYAGNVMNVDSLFDEGVNYQTSLTDFIISGWKVGFQLLEEGDSATLYIPSVLAYGSSGSTGGGIPANANLIFEVRLDRIVQPQFDPGRGTYVCYYLPDEE
jgi:FKBP-type peptidyl-prolyl cis-trans isomerase FkpA